jgi:hypothetical protein
MNNHQRRRVTALHPPIGELSHRVPWHRAQCDAGKDSASLDPNHGKQFRRGCRVLPLGRVLVGEQRELLGIWGPRQERRHDYQ